MNVLRVQLFYKKCVICDTCSWIFNEALQYLQIVEYAEINIKIQDKTKGMISV